MQSLRSQGNSFCANDHYCFIILQSLLGRLLSICFTPVRRNLRPSALWGFSPCARGAARRGMVSWNGLDLLRLFLKLFPLSSWSGLFALRRVRPARQSADGGDADACCRSDACNEADTSSDSEADASGDADSDADDAKASCCCDADDRHSCCCGGSGGDDDADCRRVL